MDINILFQEKTLPWITSHGIKIIIILILAYVLHKVSKKAISKIIKKVIIEKGNNKESEEKREKTLESIFHNALHIIIIVITILMVLQELGVNIGPLIAGAGIIGLAFGFGGQYLIKDIITGLFIILENQYRVGDIVEISGLSGIVERISLRITTLRDANGVVHSIPHGEIKTVSNMSKGISKVNIDLGVGYETNINEAEKIINEVGQNLIKDEKWSNSIKEAPKFLRVQELGDSAITLRITGTTKPGKQFQVAGELRKRLKEACDQNNINIPYPQIEIRQAKN